MCVTIHIPVFIAIYMYMFDKLFIFVEFSWIKLAKIMIKTPFAKNDPLQDLFKSKYVFVKTNDYMIFWG
jgi:hypothetical protein